MRWISNRLPEREAIVSKPFLRPFAHRLVHPSLWHFNRSSVSNGLALGLFCGFLLPVGQILLAAFFALTLRANLAVAAAATLVTNPFTFPAIYFAAYKLGSQVTSGGSVADIPTAGGWTSGAWLLSVSLPTAIGLVLFALASSVTGYLAVQLAWRLRVARRWARRRAA